MKKITIDIREKIAVRAYYAWLNGSPASAEDNWLAAEAIELAYGERRAMAARKAAETRRANAMLKPPPGARPALLGLTSRRPASHRVVQH